MPQQDQFIRQMRTAGYRITPPRLAVLRVFAAEDEHLHPEEVLRRAKAFCPAVGRATVYRTLELLTTLGVLRPICLGDSRPCFTRIEHGHHHLVCSQCSTVVEFDDSGLGPWARKLSRKLGFKIQSHLLEFYGLCRKCRKQTSS